MEAPDYERLRRIETLIDHLYAHLGLDPASVPDRAPPSSMPADIAALVDSGKKIHAIKLYREHYGVGLKEAHDAVEAYEKRYKLG